MAAKKKQKIKWQSDSHPLWKAIGQQDERMNTITADVYAVEDRNATILIVAVVAVLCCIALELRLKRVEQLIPRMG